MRELDGAKAAGLIFRIATLGLAVAAAVVMGTTSQSVYDLHGLSYTVQYSDYNAFLYFVMATSISAVGAAATIYLTLYRKDGSGLADAGVAVADVAVQGLLFSAGGAAFAVCSAAAWGHGGGYAPWGSVCDVAGGFCAQARTAAVLGVCAAAAASAAVLAKNVRASIAISCGASTSSCGHSCHI